MQVRVVIVSDGKRGHENQSRVLARMLGDTAPMMMNLRPHVREGGLTEVALRLRLALLGPARLSRRAAVLLVKRLLRPESTEEFRAFAGEVKERMAELTLFTVSSGTPAATLNLVLARMLGARSVVNMTPSLLPRRHFALNVVPAHDVTAGTRLPANVVVTPLALGYHERAAAELMAGQLAVEHRLERAARYWGVAIGGPSRACPWVGDRILDELAALHGLAKQHGAELLVTTSRRTPAYCTAWLRKHYLGSPQLAYFLDAAEDPLNPLPALYELSVRMFVTTDSFSMVSEAVHAGHRPVLLRVRVGCPPGKLGRALTMLEGKGLAVLGDEDAGLAARLLAEPGRADPNRHYEMLSGQVRAKLGLSS